MTTAPRLETLAQGIECLRVALGKSLCARLQELEQYVVVANMSEQVADPAQLAAATATLQSPEQAVDCATVSRLVELEFDLVEPAEWPPVGRRRAHRVVVDFADGTPRGVMHADAASMRTEPSDLRQRVAARPRA